MTQPTIFAIASAPGPGAVAVIRISGPASKETLAGLSSGIRLPAARRASLRRLWDPSDGSPIDEALVLWLPGPGSFTGEDMVELHVHGGTAVINAVTAALMNMPGLQPAAAGEFTRRAFLNERLDLTQAEALADLVAAETSAQRHQALAQLDGSLGRLVTDWQERLLRTRAHIEATIDFSDEDLPANIDDMAMQTVVALANEIRHQLGNDRRGEQLRDGVRVTVAGAPNVGKSTLFNWIAGRDVAITSPKAGTTRDVLEVRLDLGGIPVILADTAGLRETEDDVEAEGIRRARGRIETAALTLVLFDATCVPEVTTLSLLGEKSLPVWTKVDLATPAAIEPLRTALAVSAVTGSGMDDLLERITWEVCRRFKPTEPAAITRARHRQSLEMVVERLESAVGASLPELAAEDIRLAMRALGMITGQVDAEAVLDRIFRDFCIGK